VINITDTNKEKITKILIVGLCFLAFIIMTGIYLCANSTYTIHFTMDNNTLEAVKSINYTAIMNMS
jgi:hypothetical protein